MSDQTDTTHTYSVPGVSCDHCKQFIEKHVEIADGVTHVDVDVERKLVTVVGGEDSVIRAAIGDAGYDVA